MKFKLFGRLRDNDEETGSSDSAGFGGGGFGDNGGGSGNPGSSDSGGFGGGGGLERTVQNMFSQGYSEEEIKEELQGQYSQTEIERAINNTVTSSATGELDDDDAPEPMTPYQQQSDEAVSPMDEGYQNDNSDNGNDFQNSQQQSGGFDSGQMQLQQQQQQQQRPQQSQPQQQAGDTVDPAVEELIETIVAENFQRVEEEFENVYQELDIIEEKLEDLDRRVHDLEVRGDEDQQEFVQKVDEIEDHIDSYESRIGGLEKAFQQVLPSLVDNVRDLTNLVQEIKQERGIETETNVSQEEMDSLEEEW
ncbi:MAG: hypothetical protein ABEJ75_04255 [Candidatus Nanohaloarchaea archaeon]